MIKDKSFLDETQILKARTPYSKLIWGRQKRYKRHKKTSLEVIGLDTETLINGNIFLFADSLANYIWRPTRYQILKFLIESRYQEHLNFFYNLQFDSQGVLKNFSEELLKTLIVEGSIKNLPLGGGKVKPFNIKYLEPLHLRITQGHKTTYYYDLAQFYQYLSLDVAAGKFITDHKNPIRDYDFTLDNIEDRKEEIIEYCIKDAKLVQRLGEETKANFEKLGIYEKNYLSPAFFTQRYIIHWANIRKTIISDKEAKEKKATDLLRLKHSDTTPMEYAYNAYSGGWFEIQKRGHFEKLYKYDIASAYPAVMRELINIDPLIYTSKTGKEHGYREWLFSKTWIPEAKFAFVRAHLDIRDSNYISPIPLYFTEGGTPLKIYPTGEFITTITKNDFLFVNAHLGKAKLIDGWFFVCDENTPLVLNHVIDRLYKRKCELKEAAKTDPKAGVEYLNVKLLLNSMYGKFIQAIDVKELVDGNITVKGKRTGTLWNPVWASIITSEVRLQIAKAFLKRPETLASIQTDGVLTTEPLDIPLGKKLGDWDFEGSGEGLIVVSGVNEILGLKDPMRHRGFGKRFGEGGKYDSLFRYFRDHKHAKDVYVENSRPISLMEGLIPTRKEWSVADINRFIVDKKHFGFLEKKRAWNQVELTCGDLLNKTIDSKPLLWSLGFEPGLESELEYIPIEKPETLIQRIMKKGGVKSSNALLDFGKYSEIPLCCRRKHGLPFDELAEELGISDNDLWEGLVYRR